MTMTDKKLVLGLPKGSLQEATFTIFRKAGFNIHTGSRSYLPTIDDPELDIINCRSNQLLQLGPEVFENTASMLQDTLESEMEIFI